MQEIKCPNCGKVFSVDDSGYAAILKQVHDKEFEKELRRREDALIEEKESAVELAVTKAEVKKDKRIAELEHELESVKDKTRGELELALAEKNLKLSEKDSEIAKLKGQIELDKSLSESAVREAVQGKESEILKLKNDLELEQSKRQLSEKTLKEAHDAELKRKDEEIAYYKVSRHASLRRWSARVWSSTAR